MRLVWIASVVSLSALGCTRERWACEACLASDGKVCAKNDALAPGPARTEDAARCSAGEEVCSRLVGDERFAEVCRPYRTTAMMGCDEAFLAQLTFRCEAHTELSLPLPGVR